MNHPDLKPRLTRSRKTRHVVAKHLISMLRLSVHTLKSIKENVRIIILACVGESNYVLLDRMVLCT